MTFDWKEYFLISNYLVNNQSIILEEAKIRIVISRLYYSALITTRNYLEDVEEKNLGKGAEIHGVIIEILRASSDRQRQKLAEYLKMMRQERNKADYENEYPDYKTQFTRNINRARKVINYFYLQRFGTEPTWYF